MVRVRIKHGNGMNDRVDKSRGIETLMTEALSNINPIEPLRLAKQVVRIEPTPLTIHLCALSFWLGEGVD